jgi:hypothetical protein
MNRKNFLTVFCFFFAIIISFVVHYRWFNNLGIITYGDWLFIYPGALKEFVTIPYLWSTSGIGGVNLTSSGYPTILAFGLLEKIHLNYNISERLIYLIPLCIIGPASSFLLVKKFTKSAVAALVGTLVYCYNIYFLILNQSDFTILCAACIAPLALWCYITTIELRKFYLSIITGIILFTASIYEFRMFYIMCAIALLYAIYYFIFINKEYSYKSIFKYVALALIPFFMVAALNIYWLYPFYHTGLIATNDLFNRGLFGNNYLDIIHAITMTLPWWTGGFPSVFIVQKLQSYFWIIPIAAFFGLFLKRKDPNIIFFGIVGLLGIFLSKQVDNPFPNLYQYLYSNLIGFNAFREASKFFMVTAIGYSVLIGALIAWLLEHFTVDTGKVIAKYAIIIIVSGCMLYNTLPLVNGSFAASFQPKQIPNDYTILTNYIENQPEFFRTYWVPITSRFSYYDNLHPMVSAYDMTGGQWQSMYQYNDINSDIYYSIVRLMQEPIAESLLDAASIKYVIVPLNDSKEEESLFANGDKSFGNRQDFISNLNNLTFLKKINIGTKNLVIYENMGYKPDTYISLADDGDINYQFSNTKNIAIYNVLGDAKPCTPQTYQEIPTINQNLACKYVTYGISSNSIYDLTLGYDGNVSIINYYNNSYQDAQTISLNSTKETSYESLYNSPPNAQAITIIILTSGGTNGYTTDEKLTRINQITNENFLPNKTATPKTSISYQIINPTEKTFEIKEISQPELLSMSELTDSGWALFITKGGSTVGQVIDHLIRYNSFNSWVINPNQICSNTTECVKNPDGTYDITGTIEYVPQKQANKALLISVASGVIILLGLIFFWIKNL